MQYTIKTIDDGQGNQVPQTDDQGNVMVSFSYSGHDLDQNIPMAATEKEFLASCQVAYDVFKAEIDVLPQVDIPSYISQLPQG